MTTAVEARVPEHGREAVSPLPTEFERLFRAEYPRVVRVAYRVLGDEAAAEDVAQEVFLSFYRAHPATADYAAAWLHAAAAHTALNALRSRGRRATREGAQAIRYDAASPDPVETVATTETRAEVRAILARLSDRDAALLALRHAGLSYAEIAAAIDVRASSVGTLLRRAEDAFRREMT